VPGPTVPVPTPHANVQYTQRLYNACTTPVQRLYNACNICDAATSFSCSDFYDFELYYNILTCLNKKIRTVLLLLPMKNVCIAQSVVYFWPRNSLLALVPGQGIVLYVRWRHVTRDDVIVTSRCNSDVTWYYSIIVTRLGELSDSYSQQWERGTLLDLSFWDLMTCMTIIIYIRNTFKIIWFTF